MKIVKSDLTDGRLSNLVTMLKNEADDAGELLGALDSLSAVLQTKDAATGEIFNKVKSKIEDYKGILQVRKSTAESLASAIESGRSNMLAFMEDNDPIDTAEAETIRVNINRLESEIQNARAKIYSLKYYVDELSKNGIKKTINNTQYLYNLIEQNEVNLVELRKILEKIEQLPSVDSQAYSSISSLQGTISSYKSKVDGVKQSSINVPQEI